LDGHLFFLLLIKTDLLFLLIMFGIMELPA